MVTWAGATCLFSTLMTILLKGAVLNKVGKDIKRQTKIAEMTTITQ